jgi:hypothetical protein
MDAHDRELKRYLKHILHQTLQTGAMITIAVVVCNTAIQHFGGDVAKMRWAGYKYICVKDEYRSTNGYDYADDGTRYVVKTYRQECTRFLWVRNGDGDGDNEVVEDNPDAIKSTLQRQPH